MCPHSTHLRRCSHHPPTAEHSTQPVPLGLAAGLMPSLSEFIYTAPMLIGWRNAVIGGSSGAGKSSRRRRSSRPGQNGRGARWISASGRSRLNASALGASWQASPRRQRWGVSSTALLRPPVCDVRQGFHAPRRTRAPQALLALVRAKAMPLAWSAHRKILAAIAPPWSRG